MDRQWVKLNCGCDCIVGKGEILNAGQPYLCVQHGDTFIYRVNRLKG